MGQRDGGQRTAGETEDRRLLSVVRCLVLENSSGKSTLIEAIAIKWGSNRQLSMIARMHQLVRDASQFLIATHSAILMAYPDATILSCDGGALHEVAYEETEQYIVTRDF